MVRLSIVFILALTLPAQAETPAAGVEFFEKHVRPVLVEKCVSCHGPKKQHGALRLDSRAALVKGGDTGPAIDLNAHEKSLLLAAVRRVGELKMPPKDEDRLDKAQIEAITAWVKMGAPWPDGTPKKDGPLTVAEAREKHWSFRPVARPALPEVKNAGWVKSPVDRFVLATLEAKKLTPSAPADRRTLIRRLTFDLTGLPPTPDEIEAFVGDTAPNALERAVDRLLSSPAYGERWGRHWLDVARYADTKGYVFQEERRYPYSYTYRDYTIAAFNTDKPYDRFVVEQLAADLLPLGEDRSPLAAMGFLTLGRRFLNNVHDIIDDRIDTLSRGLMGLTVSCARCHDHKFDPLPTKDYYSLYGVLASATEPGELPLIVPPDQSKGSTAFEKELQVRQGKVDQYLQQQHAILLPKLRAAASDHMLAATTETAAKKGERGFDPARRQLVPRWREYLNNARKAHHAVLAPWLAFASPGKESFASIAARITANSDPKSPINPLIAKAFAGDPPATLADVAKKYKAVFEQVEAAWQEAAKKTPSLMKLSDADAEAVRQVLVGPGAPTNIAVGEINMYFDRAQRDRLTALRRQVDQFRATAPDAPPRAMVLADRPSPFVPRVFVRGNPGNQGPIVPRQFLEVLAPQRRPFAKGSGRLELAESIASKDNPLTARVMVNRVWLHHFGKGIVKTPGDFGLRGEPPSHPELLDWLASEFVANGWSVKKLHRLIVLSAVYQQSSEEDEAKAAIDPENDLLWRMNRRRLEFEPLRDALLMAAGGLDRRMGGKAVEIAAAPYAPRRSVYGFIDRQNLPGVFRTFDLASPDASTPQRHSTTVPQQALFLMNGPFALAQAQAFAARDDVRDQPTDAAKVQQMYRIAYGRNPDAEEMEMALKFVRGNEARRASEAVRKAAWEQLAQVVLLGNEFAFVD